MLVSGRAAVLAELLVIVADLQKRIAYGCKPVRFAIIGVLGAIVARPRVEPSHRRQRGTRHVPRPCRLDLRSCGIFAATPFLRRGNLQLTISEHPWRRTLSVVLSRVPAVPDPFMAFLG